MVGAKEKLTVWVSPSVAKAVKSMAAAQGVSTSQMAAQLLEVGSKDQAELAGLGLLIPALEGVMRRESRALGDRLARLLAVAALESATGRHSQFQILVEMFGVDRAKQISNGSYASSVARLKTTSEGVRELLGVVDPPAAGVAAATPKIAATSSPVVAAATSSSSSSSAGPAASNLTGG